VDILAGSGPLGLDSPTLVVEVKSEPTQIMAQVARGLQGAVSTNQAHQGLLVAWGGINSAVKREFSTNK
jgi:restriction system protein